MNICVVTPIDKNSRPQYIKLGQASYQINKKYCQLNGYDYKYEEFDNNIIPDKNEDFSNPENRLYFNTVNIEKFLIIQKYLPYYDYIAFNQLDVAFVNPNMRIEQFIDGQHDIYISHANSKAFDLQDMAKICNIFIPILNNRELTIKWIQDFYLQCKQLKKTSGYDLLKNMSDIGMNPYRINGGVFIFKNSETGRNLVNDCIKYYNLFTKLNSAPEEAVLGFLISRNPGIQKLLPDNYQAHFNGSGLVHYDQNTSFTLHNYSWYSDIQRKIDAINSLKTNKWWKEYFKK